MDRQPRKPKYARWTIQTLNLDIEAAQNGKVWLILPEGFRDRESGGTYPLPGWRRDLHTLASIFIPAHQQSGGTKYLRRARVQSNLAQRKKLSAVLDVSRRANDAEQAQRLYKRKLAALAEDARKAVEKVQEEAEQAVASLHDLFSLGRKGIDGQMRAHLDGKEWKDEKINARAFRECFRIVTQTVKGLGLPSDQRPKAVEAILEEVAASIEETQDAASMAPGGDDPETEN